MLSASVSEPDPAGPIIYVGQDSAGHWLVQDSNKCLEGRFVSQAAAMSFARAERQIYHGSMMIAVEPLAPLVSFAPLAAHEHAQGAGRRAMTSVVVRQSRAPASSHKASAPVPGSSAARRDPRWPALDAALVALRLRGRCAVRIVDADCGAGALLLAAAGRARALGFTAIEGRGIDGSPALVGQARRAAGSVADPAIGIAFELADAQAALRDEADFPADIVLWSGARRPGIDEALSRAADLVIRDPAGRGDGA